MLKDRLNCIYLCLNSIYNINSHPNKVTSITSQVTTTTTSHGKCLRASNVSAFANHEFESHSPGISSWEEEEQTTEWQLLSAFLMLFFFLVFWHGLGRCIFIKCK